MMRRATIGLRTACAVAALLSGPHARAQIATDGTVGPRVDLGASDATIGQDLGRAVGGNLFHSFDSFQVNEGAIVTFTGDSGFDHVISRVTGGEATRIDGLLRSDVAGADFWLLNPNGVMVGDTSAFDVPAGLHLGAADHVRFADGATFSATETGSTLSMAAPEAFGFVGGEAAIELGRTSIALERGSALTLAGGSADFVVTNVTVPSGHVAILAPGGDIDFVGTLVNLNDNRRGGGDLRVQGGEISLFTSALVARGGSADAPAADITVQADRDIVLERSSIRTDGDFLPPDLEMIDPTLAPRGGDVVLQAGGDVVLDDFAAITTEAYNLSDGGDITIEARNIRIVRAGRIDTSTLPLFYAGEGDAGDITLRAAETVEISGGLYFVGQPPNYSGVSTVSDVESFGNGGDISIEGGSILIADGAFVSQSIDGGFIDFGQSSDGGTITLTAHQRIELTREGEVTSFGGPDASQTNGSVILRAPEIALTAGGRITSILSDDTEFFNTPRDVDGGPIVLEGDRIVFDGRTDFAPVATGIFPSNAFNTFGEMSPVVIRGGSFELLAGGVILADTNGQGQASPVTVELTGDFTADPLGSVLPTSIVTITRNVSGADAGPISVSARNVILAAGAQLFSATTSSGRGGDIVVEAEESVRLLGQEPFFGIPAAIAAGGEEIDVFNRFPIGRGGDIEIRAPIVEVRDGAFIGSASANISDAGQVRIEAPERLTIDGQFVFRPDSDNIVFPSQISAASTGTGDAANLTVVAGDVVISNGARIVTEAAEAAGGTVSISATGPVTLTNGQIATSVLGGTGGGGDVAVATPSLVLRDGVIQANAVEGDGGNIDITADSILRSSQSVIEASSQLGVDGVIATSTPEADIAGDVAPLDSRVGAVEVSLAACGAAAGGRLVQEARVGPSPEIALVAPVIDTRGEVAVVAGFMPLCARAQSVAPTNRKGDQ